MYIAVGIFCDLLSHSDIRAGSVTKVVFSPSSTVTITALIGLKVIRNFPSRGSVSPQRATF